MQHVQHRESWNDRWRRETKEFQTEKSTGKAAQRRLRQLEKAKPVRKD